MKITLTKEQIKEKIEAIKALFAPQKSEPTESSYNLKDGTAVKCIGDLKPGSEFKVVTDTGDQPAPDGDFEMEDGTVVKCTGGLITEVNPADPDDENKDDSEATKKEMKAEFARVEGEYKEALKTQKEAFETHLANQTQILTQMLELVTNMAEEPGAEPVKKTLQQIKAAEKLTKKEQSIKLINEIRNHEK